MQNVKGAFPDRQVDTLFNDNFIVSRLQEEFSSEQPTVVHIASHGQFGSEAKDTFIVTYEEGNPLTLNRLEQLVKVNNFKGRRPVGLLVLMPARPPPATTARPWASAGSPSRAAPAAPSPRCGA